MTEILIVDDNPINLKLTKLLLAKEGYRVLTAGSAEEALQSLENTRPRLILMDLQLPGMSGLELTAQLKADPAFQDLVIVAVTAYAMKGDEEKALASGCDGYISKPLDVQTFASQVAGYLKE
ncbi:MAG TPA: response regulator [bacterium]|nr:response regulator [bacterium]